MKSKLSDLRNNLESVCSLAEKAAEKYVDSPKTQDEDVKTRLDIYVGTISKNAEMVRDIFDLFADLVRFVLSEEIDSSKLQSDIEKKFGLIIDDELPIKTELTQADIDRYIKSGGEYCMHCGCTILNFEEHKSNDGAVLGKVKCTNCNASWEDHIDYTIRKVVITNPPIRTTKKLKAKDIMDTEDDKDERDT